MEMVRKSFRPEFVNRIDEFIVFQPLSLDQIKQIVRMQVSFLHLFDLPVRVFVFLQ
jgi:ATP-dependent Clp protease ATP-binding subunit ClpA